MMKIPGEYGVIFSKFTRESSRSNSDRERWTGC